MPATRGGAGPSAAKPPPPASTASSSSLSSGRQDRNARTTTTQKSATPHSQSSEEMSEPPRRSQRSQLPKKEEVVKEDNDIEDEVAVDGEEEEEITRCVCGHQEYPGAPLSEAFNSIDVQSEDAGGLFISCDGCSVWQHGGCVGILEESQVPDKYYCEECKPKLHELHTDTRGQKYSLYQPVYGKPNRKASVSKHGEKASKERELVASSRASADPVTGRRRATMRSKEHDDEEEQLRRAIEESKRGIDGTGNGRRNGKRGRDDSDESKQHIKRQRRASEAAPLKSKIATLEDESDDDRATINTLEGKKARAEAVQSARQVELKEKEKERERARAEAAGRRQERAGKRRADEEASEETPKPSTSAKTSPPPSSQPESPQPQGPPEKVSHKKGAGKKTKKLGNNQYTKNRGVANPSSPPNGKNVQSANNQSASSGDEPMANGDPPQLKINGNGTGTNKNSPERGTIAKGKFGKGKHKGVNGNGNKHALEEPAELTMATMKRRMDAMAAFIAKAQTEPSGDRTPSNGGIPRISVEDAGFAGGAVRPPTSGQVEEPVADGKKFEEMSAMEMADVVSRSIGEWRSKFSLVV